MVLQKLKLIKYRYIIIASDIQRQDRETFWQSRRKLLCLPQNSDSLLSIIAADLYMTYFRGVDHTHPKIVFLVCLGDIDLKCERDIVSKHFIWWHTKNYTKSNKIPKNLIATVIAYSPAPQYSTARNSINIQILISRFIITSECL